MILAAVILLLCVSGVLHTYLIYPWQMARWARTQVPLADPENSVRGIPPAPPVHPPVAVLMAAHNEAAVLDAKLRSLADQDYPGSLRFLIGSDNSTDGTNDILARWAARDGRFEPLYFGSRQGKPAIINQLATRVTSPPATTILLLTDASVLLRPNVVTALVRPFVADPGIAVVDATMVQTGARPEGVGQAETAYIDREVALKRAEGRRWGYMIGPFGGCWALRAAAFRPVPDTFLVDDFYLCLSAYAQGYRGVSSPAAVVEEPVGQSLAGEFRRKARIGAGNWQNLVHFRQMWWPPGRSPLAYAWFSHKILRWWTPLLLLLGAAAWATLCLTLPAPANQYARILLLFAIGGLLGFTLVDLLLQALGVHWAPARYVRYFLAMNLALLVGFWRYLTGIKTNVWQPSSRD